LNPLVKWIWFGGIVVVLGTLLALVPNRRAVIVLKPVTDSAWGGAIADGLPAAVQSVVRRVGANE
jgi:cytochrome c biogenesis factor